MDLNDDVVLSDPRGDGVKSSEHMEGEGLNVEVVDRVNDSEVKLGFLDSGIEEKGGIVSKPDGVNGSGEGREGLEGAQFGGGGAVIVANGKGVGLESEAEESFRSVDSSFGVEKERGKDGTLKECAEDEVVSAVKGDRSKSFEVKLNVVAEIDSVGEVTDDIPGVEVKVVDLNESLDHQDLNASTQSKKETCEELEIQGVEANVEAQTNENGLDMLNGVIDLNPSMKTDEIVSSDNGKGKPAFSELEFHDSELVWGKVRSHPWWPGQIFDPSASSEKAKKYCKRGAYLIAYFWDCTFAWNEAPQIKPFFEHFSQMEKQSDMEEFQDAIACALDEISRRVEFGLACSCIPKEVYSKLKTQVIVNAGIKEEASRREGGDSSLGVASFEPMKLLKFMKKSAQFPYSKADRLELVKSRAQLLAFYRWKGYSQLPQFNMLGGLLDDADILQLEEKRRSEVSENALPVIKDEDLVQKSKRKDNSSRKRKDISGDSVGPSKKEKSSSDAATGKYLSTPVSENGSKKRKAVDDLADDSAVKQNRSDSSTGADGNSQQDKKTFKVGDRICRVASQLSGSSPILKNCNATSTEAAVQDKGKVKMKSEKPQTEKLAKREYPSPDEMLSQLCLAAIDPMNGYSLLTSMITCFSEFRNTICLDRPSSEKPQLSLKQLFGKLRKKSARTGKKSISSGITEKSDSEAIPHEQPSLDSQNDNGELVPEAPTDMDTSTVAPQSSLELIPNADSDQKIAAGDLVSETVNTLGSSESCEEEPSPTALILKFTDVESVPSEVNLNKIFSCYGPLKEVLRKSSRAMVVFSRRADAETAFSSTGKYSTFGASLVSYSLKFLQSTPSKASPSKQSKKDALSSEGTVCQELKN